MTNTSIYTENEIKKIYDTLFNSKIELNNREDIRQFQRDINDKTETNAEGIITYLPKFGTVNPSILVNTAKVLANKKDDNSIKILKMINNILEF